MIERIEEGVGVFFSLFFFFLRLNAKTNTVAVPTSERISDREHYEFREQKGAESRRRKSDAPRIKYGSVYPELMAVGSTIVYRVTRLTAAVPAHFPRPLDNEPPTNVVPRKQWKFRVRICNFCLCSQSHFIV